MVKVTWEIDGRRVDPRNAKDALMSAIMSRVTTAVEQRLRGCLCPEHRQHPTVVVTGPATAPKFQVKGCCDDLAAEVRRKLS